MTRSRISVLLITSAALALAACSGTEGPGKIGSKDDIVIRNKNMPGQAQAAQGGDFSTTVEQGEAVPAPAVAAAEQLAPPAQSQPLPDTSPAMQQAVAAHDAAQAAPQTVETPADASRAAVAENKPIDAIAPTTPVNAPAPVPPPASPAPVLPQQYVATQTPSAAPAPVPAAAPVSTPAPAAAPAVPVLPEIAAAAPNPAVRNMPYPLDPNAPYSPRKIAQAQAAASTPYAPATAPAALPAADASAPSMNPSDASMVRAVQAALAVKGAYTGPQTGIIDADFLNALTKYQGANGLPMGGVNEATLRHLGIIE